MKGTHEPLIFAPRPSKGWLSLLLLGLVMVVLFVPLMFVAGEETPTWIVFMNLGLLLLFGVPMFALAIWFPTMRYTLDEEALHLRYGPILHYRIPLAEIRGIRRRNLNISLWSSLRLPGVALFKVPYADVGTVKMCATAATCGILLIETEGERYGLTPSDEEAFVAALRARLER